MRVWLVIFLFGASFLFGQSDAKLQPGDTLVLIFSSKEDGLDGTYTVSKDGNLTLPFIGKMAVQGLSVGETSRAVRKKYLDDQIYTGLSVAAFKNLTNFLTIPNPAGEGTIRVIAPNQGSPPGDFPTPKEKKKLFQIDQMDVRKGE